MSRRSALTFVALIAALLVLAVVPLGISLTANLQTSFRYDAQASAHQVAAAAEETLADTPGGGLSIELDLPTAPRQSSRHGDTGAGSGSAPG